MLKVDGDMLGRKMVTDDAGPRDRLSGPIESRETSATTRDPVTFRRALAVHLLALLGTASLAGSSGGCWDGETTLTGFGGGGTTGDSGTGDSGATTGTTGSATSSATSTCALAPGGTPCGDFPAQRCFTPAAFPCPTDPCVALGALTTCGNDGLEPCQIQSGPMQTMDMCCYETVQTLCGAGGRAYLVEDRAVVAAPLFGADDRGWIEGARPALDAMTPEERAVLAEAWTASGLLEHASVASFSRSSLSLLAAGAPAELVLGTHRAALDEIVHARLCFALASAYRGEAIAPGPFPVAGDVHVSANLAAIAVSTVEEGCIGETVAAIVASEQLARATDSGGARSADADRRGRGPSRRAGLAHGGLGGEGGRR